MLTKTQIEALTGEQVNDLVTEQAMNRIRFGEVTQAGLRIPLSWADKKGTTPFVTGDGTTANVPNYALTRMPEETPDYLTDEWHAKLVGKMLRKGYRLELFRTGTDFSAAFYVPPASPVPIVTSDDRDAVRRAALLAVQT